MADDYYFWPEEDECLQIASQIYHKYGQIHCAGYLDGVLFTFCTTSCTIDCGDYHGRKLGQKISETVSSDENLFIRSLNAGWPGRVYEDRILAHSKIWKK